MAKRNIESSGNKNVERNCRNRKGANSPSSNRAETTPRVSPVIKMSSSPPVQRTSPGLLAGHYAGCKWTEPPSPSALPLPPHHWMQQQSSITSKSALILDGADYPASGNHSKKLLPFTTATNIKSDHHHDISSQLKVLLKVQA